MLSWSGGGGGFDLDEGTLHRDDLLLLEKLSTGFLPGCNIIGLLMLCKPSGSGRVRPRVSKALLMDVYLKKLRAAMTSENEDIIRLFLWRL